MKPKLSGPTEKEFKTYIAMKRFYVMLVCLFALATMSVAQNVWSVKLVSATNPRATAPVVAAELNIHETMALVRVAQAPIVLLEDVTRQAAEDFARRLQETGATTDLLLTINTQTFPDADFRSFVVAIYDGDRDGRLSESEREAVRTMNAAWKSIRNLKGIGFFNRLEALNCSCNPLDTLDLSANTALKELDCSCNPLSTLDLSANTALEKLVCTAKSFDRLDLSANTALKELDCSGNQLTALDLSANTALEKVYCYHNKISGDAMTALLASLEDRRATSQGLIVLFIYPERSEGNVCTQEQTAIAMGKNWKVQALNHEQYSYEDVVSTEEAMAGYVEINETNFPDSRFRDFVGGMYDANYDLYLSKAEREAVQNDECRLEKHQKSQRH